MQDPRSSDIQSSPKEMQLPKTSFSFGEECNTVILFVYCRAHAGVLCKGIIDNKTTAGCSAYFDHTDEEYWVKHETESLWKVLDEKTTSKFSLNCMPDHDPLVKPFLHSPVLDECCSKLVQDKLYKKQEEQVPALLINAWNKSAPHTSLTNKMTGLT